MSQMDFTAIIRRGEKQFVALCPEIDVVSQGYTIEDALKNLKEAVEVYIEEMGFPEEIKTADTIIAHFEVSLHGKIASALRA
ncbi:MAG: type II toxin-antitoxin system HicB family antitoxin [Candidatus Methanoperedens sp.]